MKIKHIINAIFLLFLVAGTVYILGFRERPQTRHVQGNTFGTSYHITYIHTTQLDSLIRCELAAVDNSLSMFNEKSTVARINSGETTLTDSLFREVFLLSRSVSLDTRGAFDPTVAPLVNVWGFGFQSGEGVDSVQVDSILQFVGIDKVWLEKDRLLKQDSRTMFDFSAIAKGYALDRIARVFDSLHVKNYMIEIGGEVVVKGEHPDNRPWIVGIECPTEEGSGQHEALQEKLALRDAAMATSGNYRRFYVKDGKRYAHTIDPHTGYPVSHNLLSATVIAPDCAWADAYATAFMVMGLDEAKKIVSTHDDLEAYFIYSTPDGMYATWCSEGLEKKILKDRSKK